MDYCTYIHAEVKKKVNNLMLTATKTCFSVPEIISFFFIPKDYNFLVVFK